MPGGHQPFCFLMPSGESAWVSFCCQPRMPRYGFGYDLSRMPESVYAFLGSCINRLSTRVSPLQSTYYYTSSYLQLDRQQHGIPLGQYRARQRGGGVCTRTREHPILHHQGKSAWAHVSKFQLTDSGPRPMKSPKHTWYLSMVSFLFRTKSKADKQDSARVFIDTTISSDS